MVCALPLVTPHPQVSILHGQNPNKSTIILHTTDSITPTVELNALAMKLGHMTSYRPIEAPHPQYYPPQATNFRGIYNHR